MSYKKITLLTFLVIVMFACKRKISDVNPSADQLVQYELLEVDFNLKLPFQDPYDARAVQVDMVVQKPEGGNLLIPCYYENGPSGDSKWRARFTPRLNGVYKYYIRATDGKNRVDSKQITLNVVPSDTDGFIVLSPVSDFSFRFDSGKPFRGIGENFGWEARRRDNPNLTYDYIFKKFSEHGMNITRTWMCPWNLPLEWKKPKIDNTYHSFYEIDSGTYNVSAIDRVDFMIREAEKNGVYVILVLDYHGALKTEPDYWGGNNFWLDHNYNKANGGSAVTPEEFFTNADAMDMYKNRLRYLIARWGYSPNLLAWEFWNEVDNAMASEKISGSAIVKWHGEMAKYLDNTDPYDHLVTTSVSHRDIEGLFDLEDIDITQTHLYGKTMHIPAIVDSVSRKFSKPYIAGEFSYDWRNVTAERMPEFRADLKKGLWLGLFSRTPVLPMTWWWETYEKENFYGVFRTISGYSEIMMQNWQIPLVPLDVSCPPGIKGYVLDQGEKVFGYFTNTTSTEIFYPIEIFDLKWDKYMLNIYNTDANDLERISVVETDGGICTIEMLKFEPEGDLAIVLEKVD